MSSSSANAPRALLAGRVLAFAGIALAAFSMRAAVAGLSPLIPIIGQTYELNTAAIALLGSIAPLSFAAGGVFTPRIEKRIGLERTMILSLLLMVIGHVLRATSVNWQTLSVGTLFALVGMGFANVAMPPVVRKYFPDRISLMTSVYMSIMSVSALLPALVAVPVADAISWRGSLLQWALYTAVALFPWIMEYRAHRKDAVTVVTDETQVARKIHIWRSPTAWAVGTVLAVSSITGYAMYAWMPVILIDIAGVNPAQSGALLALFTGMGLPLAFIIPGLAKRMGIHSHWLVWVSSLFFASGYIGLIFFPHTLTWLWTAVVGVGCLEFPLAMVLINLRTENQRTAMALSGFAQIVAYMSAAIAPPIMGALHEATGSWTLILTVLMIVSVAANIPTALILRRGRTVNSELRSEA